MLAPGIFEERGGMFSYLGLWIGEIKKYSNNYGFYLDKKFEGRIAQSNVSYLRFFSEKKSRMIVISILGLVLPLSLHQFFFKEYRKIVREAQVVHVLTSSLYAYLLLQAILRFNPKITLIYTLHDPIPHDEKRTPLARYIKNYYLEKIYEMSRNESKFYLHIHSKHLLDDVGEKAGQVIILPHPLPEKRVHKKKISDGYLRFGFMGRIEAYKGLEVMKNAFSILVNEEPLKGLIKLIIVGSGELNPKDWNIPGVDVSIDNRRVSEDEFHTYMANLDCIILPYIKATQSGVGYLALAYDVPIIATDTGALREIVEQSNDPRSTVIPPGDPEALSNAIRSFIVTQKHPG